MKSLLRLAMLSIALAGICVTSTALAQNFPSKSIRFVVPAPPGGSIEILLRPIAHEMTKSLGQPVVLDYKPGAGTTIGADYIAKSSPDGYNIIMLLASHATNATLMPKLPYDTLKDFAPVTLAANLPVVLVVNAQSDVKTVQELIAYARANPGKLNYASPSTGTVSHLSVELLKMMAGINVVHVPYSGSGPAIAALLGRNVDLMFDAVSSSLPQIRAGKFRALALSTSTRSNLLPEVPTMQEAGVPGFDAAGWYAVFAAAGTPAPIVQKLNAEVIKAMRVPEARERIEAAGYQIVGSTPAQLDALLKSEIVRWAKVIKDTGMKIE